MSSKPASISSSRRRFHVRLGLVAAFVVAAAVPVLHSAVVFPHVLGVPKWDQWSMVPVWSAYFESESVLPLLTGPYNSHYNVIPRMVFFGLGLLTNWDPRWEVVLSYGAALATLGLLLMMLRDSGRLFLLLAWVPALQVFSMNQFENYLSGYPFGQMLSQAAATLTVFLLTRPELGWRQVVLAALGAAVASFSWGAGFAAWPVGLLALLLRAPSRRIMLGLWIVASAGVGVVVWLGAQESGVAGSAFSAGLKPVLFALAILGNSLTLIVPGDLPTAMWLGSVMVGGFTMAALGCVALGDRKLLVIRWSVLGGLSLGSCLLIGLGRHYAGLEQALASHYTTAAYPLTIATVVLGAACLLNLWRRSRTLARWLAAATCLALLTAATVQPLVVGERTLEMLQAWRDLREGTVQRLLQGALSDDEIRRHFHPDPALVRQGLDLHRRHRFSWYAKPSQRGGHRR